MDRLDLYELCVQRPALCAVFLRTLHGHQPRVLLEDFCGTAQLSRHWAESDPLARSIARDIDPAVLERARSRASAADVASGRLELIRHDVIAHPQGIEEQSIDVVFVGNFSIGEVHHRRDLVRYLTRAREFLRPDGRGVFVCDTYGGSSAWRTGGVTRVHLPPEPAAAAGLPSEHVRVIYTWEQREADPLTCRVRNLLHFRVERNGEIEQELGEAFDYRWRLWSAAELSEAMLDAGFARVSLHDRLDDPQSRPDPRAACEHHIVCVAGWR